jgi:hypothetical protein
MNKSEQVKTAGAVLDEVYGQTVTKKVHRSTGNMESKGSRNCLINAGRNGDLGNEWNAAKNQMSNAGHFPLRYSYYSLEVPGKMVRKSD